MHYALTTTLPLLLLAATATSISIKTGNLGDAKLYTDNPAGKQFIASFHGTGAHGNLQFNLTNFNNKTGVFVKLDLTAYRGDEGPFKLSLYEAPVSGNGKCDGAKNVLDPFQRGDKPECDKRSPQTCQVGDLTGKHGEIPKFQGVISVKQNFQDLYLSFKKEEKSFIGKGSVIVKNAKGDKIGCGNILEVHGAASTWGPKGNGPPLGGRKGPGYEPIFGHGNAPPPWRPSPAGGPPRAPPSPPPPPPMVGIPFIPERFEGNGKGDRYKPKGHKSWLSKFFALDRDGDAYYRGRHDHSSPWGKGKKWGRDDDGYNGYR